MLVRRGTLAQLKQNRQTWTSWYSSSAFPRNGRLGRDCNRKASAKRIGRRIDRGRVWRRKERGEKPGREGDRIVTERLDVLIKRLSSVDARAINLNTS